MSLSFPVNPSTMCLHVHAHLSLRAPVCVRTGIVCVVYRTKVVECRCAHACVARMGYHKTQHHHLPLPDLTQLWTLLPWQSIRIIYPARSLSFRLMHRGVKHLVMLNHSGAQHARSHLEWQHKARDGADRLRGRNTTSPLGRAREGAGGGVENEG